MYYPSIMNSDESGNMAGNAAKKITRPPLPVRFSQIEKAWLKALLDKEEARMILSRETFDKLQKELAV